MVIQRPIEALISAAVVVSGGTFYLIVRPQPPSTPQQGEWARLAGVAFSQHHVS